MVYIGNTGHISATAPRAYGVPKVSPSGATLSLTHLHTCTSLHCTLYLLKGPESGAPPRGHPPHAASQDLTESLKNQYFQTLDL